MVRTSNNTASVKRSRRLSHEWLRASIAATIFSASVVGSRGVHTEWVASSRRWVSSSWFSRSRSIMVQVPFKLRIKFKVQGRQHQVQVQVHIKFAEFQARGGRDKTASRL